MAVYIRKSYKFMSFIYVINCNSCHKFTKMYLFILELFKKSVIQNYNYVIKIIIQIQFMAFCIRKSYKFVALQNGMNYKLYNIKYLMSFENTTPKEYQRLINNKNRIFDLTFKTPEILNRYRNNKDIYEEIKYSEKQNKKLENYDKIFYENLDKYFIEIADKKKIDEVSRYNYNIIKKKKRN